MIIPPGKLPAPLLQELLSKVARGDPRVHVGPGIGRDAAVIEFGGRVLVAKMDPVTFAGEHAAWYAVNVNANDIACMGGRPAWFMATALLPAGTTDADVRRIFAELNEACAQLGVELVGGHTEVTPAVTRAVISGAMLGEADAAEIVTGESVAAGDCVLLTKGVAIEGTALLARECGEDLARRGVSRDAIERAAGMLFDPGISIVPEARALCAAVRPKLMHDPTEGGIATALQELAGAAGATIRLIVDIPVLDETRTICEALGLDPLGLLASGALLAVVAADDVDAAIGAVRKMNIACQEAGSVEAGPARVIMGAEESARPLQAFARDEIARFFDERADPHSSTSAEGTS